MATTPDEWLPILAKRLDDRAPRIKRLRSYSNGDAPMPEMGKNTREAWAAFQRKARGGFGYLIASALSNRIVPLGVTVGGSTESPAAVAARRIYRDNRLAVAFRDAIMDAFEVSIGYLLTGVEDGQAVVTREMPEYVITAQDPLRPWRSRAALKVWRDEDLGHDFAYVWVDGTRQRYSREIVPKDEWGNPLPPRVNAADAGWVPDGDPESYDGSVPVQVLENRGGVGEYERHTDLIDRINLGVLNRMVVVAMQAFRQRAVKGDLVDKDEAGNDIDWAKLFEPAPGAMWELPEGVDIWESQSTDITPLLSAVKDDLRDLSATSETPLASLVPDGANQSAQGAAFQQMLLVAKAKDRIERFRPDLALVLVRALAVEGFDEVDTVDVMFEPAEFVSITERYAAAVQAKGAGESWASIRRNILGYTPEQIRQDDADRAAERLEISLMTGGGTDAQSGAAQQAPAGGGTAEGGSPTPDQ